MSEFSIVDKRGVRAPSSKLVTGNLSSEMTRLRQAGAALPTSPSVARAQTAQIKAKLTAPGALANDVRSYNRSITAETNRQRLASTRLGYATDVDIAMPKIRQPMSSLRDKNIPFDVEHEASLQEIRAWCRLFSITHDLVPLLIEIYSKFPLLGLELDCPDPQIKDFYETLFFDQLNYTEFLPNAFAREYFTVGEVTSFAHFSETLGVWSSEEILNPDLLSVSKSMFVQEERVQLRVKAIVESLRTGPEGSTSIDSREETPSERLERNREFEQLTKLYPEFVSAAANDDGLDLSDALVSRIVNKSSPWHLRGTPHLLRSFRTLMMEESLNAAQDAVCLLAGTPVLTKTGFKSIEEVQSNELVMTHQGRYRRVLRTMKRQADEAGVTITPKYHPPLTLTGEHPVYVRRKAVRRGTCTVCGVDTRNRTAGERKSIVCSEHDQAGVTQSGRKRVGVCSVCGGVPSKRRGDACSFHDPENQEWEEGFLAAKHLRLGDEVLTQFGPSEYRDTLPIWDHLNRSDYVVYDSKDRAFGFTGHEFYETLCDQAKIDLQKRIKFIEHTIQDGDIIRPAQANSHTKFYMSGNIKLTDDLLWLIGLHVADGNAYQGTISITLGADEMHLAERAARVLRESFGVESYIEKLEGQNWIDLRTSSSIVLGQLFRSMCGVGHTKNFPSWAVALPPEQCKSLIEGWLDGDGCFSGGEYHGSSAYRTLGETAAFLWRKTGASVSHTQQKNNKDENQWKCTTEYTSYLTSRSGAFESREEGKVWTPIWDVKHHQVTDTVYNLEVEEDNSYCVPYAVHNCDRLYSPFILATLGIPDLGDGTPWIPTADQLSDAKGDFQTALMADFRLMVHNFGLKIESVFGRESVPRFDQDYDRVDEKLLQAWGIGKALISGGTASAGTYASTALNREFVTQVMVTFQNQVKRHMRKRMEVVAEAQGHYDYERKGDYKRPKYREVLQIDPETGEEIVVRVPKFLIPEVKFQTLNLRDEAQERQFLQSLREMGVPISDKALSVNIPIEFKSELERQSDETVQKGLAKAQAMRKLQMLCDRDGLPYPEELAMHLSQTLNLRGLLAQTEGTEDQVDMQEKQMEMMSPAGQMGILPPPPGSEEDGDANGPESGPSQGEQGPPMAMVGSSDMKPPHVNPDVNGSTVEQTKIRPIEIQRNRTRPEESDEKRADQPRSAKFKNGPSSYKHSMRISEAEVLQQIERREKLAKHEPTDDLQQLVFDDGFWQITNLSSFAAQVQADFPEILSGRGKPETKESEQLLREAIETYEAMYGCYIPINF